ncbi:MuDRA-like transposase [Cucumis melo var. makuwa]|uniref:MuDRA-like transposase n=1 Tax=Cucumis melo var. makuwa TaxID=1194695 RepID=A0A5A7UXI4_CUCMM|nr:MuDRA-like transposase [Cucumis melo var. makuwa]
MTHVRILVRHSGAWDEGRRKYEGGVLKGIVVPKEITHKDLQYELYDLAEVDPTKFDIKIRCIYEIKGKKEAPPFELSNDRDLKFYILSENPLEVGLCDNMIGTNSTIWESYESYHSKDDTFTWESVEMYNELFDITEQRDAPTKDCKGKGKVDYSSSSRKLKTKGSGWSEESSTSEELDFVVKKSTKEVLFVRCIDKKCGWRLRAASKILGCWRINKVQIKGPDRIYKPRDIIEDMRQDYGINMSYEKAWRARENAYEESYNLLRRYGEALKFTNPGTIFHMELEDDRFFKYLFIAVGACVRGFLNCIRPVIVMDRTFFKNKYRRQSIVAVCLDGNNKIYPLAFGVVDRETDDSIQWFLEKLKGAIGEVPNLGLVTDRKTCFSKGISSVFPSAFHDLCVQHLSQNLHDKYKNDTVATLFYNASEHIVNQRL